MSNLNYGVIGNCRTAALISETGNIEWLCFPEFDSPSIFAALLDRKNGGNFGFQVSNKYSISQSYVPHTNLPVFLQRKENSLLSILCHVIIPKIKMSITVLQKFIVISIASKDIPDLKSIITQLQTTQEVK